MSNKILTITGKNNIDSIFINKKSRIKSKALDKDLTHESAIDTLLNIKEGIDKKEIGKAAWREIENKINSYKHQDIKKNIHKSDTLINFSQVKKKLIESNLHCVYCKEEVKILYRLVRDPKQWTLDRIDNDKNHTDENTVIACLDCNLKRRRIKKEHFEFSKNLNIVKLEKK